MDLSTSSGVPESGQNDVSEKSSFKQELDQIENFFDQLQKPSNLEQIHKQAQIFCETNKHLKFVLVTV